MSLQLTLGVNLRDDATFSNFYLGHNRELMLALRQLIAGTGERFVYLWGAVGVGRSHVLQACCHAVAEENQSTIYLPFREPQRITPDILQGLEMMSLVCIDDIEVVLGDPKWEEALMHFYNRARDSGTRFIVSATSTPTQLPCQLPDLQSRLAWGLVFQMKGLTDEQKVLALQMRASYRGLELSREVAQYLLRRYPRDMSVLFNVLNRLDHASLVAQRRLTIPFVKNVLERYASTV